MKDAAEAIDRLLSQLGTVLRYIAPGFAALLVVAATIPDSRPFLLGGSPAVVVLGMLLRPAIYGVHTGAVLRLLWFPVVWLHKRKWPGAILREMSELDNQRWLRRAGDQEAKEMQAEMDKWSAMLNFMYCLSYTMVLIPLAAKMIEHWSVSSEARIVLGGGLVVLSATLASEWRITGKEIEFAGRYPDGKTQTEQSDAANSGSAGASPE